MKPIFSSPAAGTFELAKSATTAIASEILFNFRSPLVCMEQAPPAQAARFKMSCPT
jgi:hypothetical protein